jgi:hypothetical protein
LSTVISKQRYGSCMVCLQRAADAWCLLPIPAIPEMNNYIMCWPSPCIDTCRVVAARVCNVCNRRTAWNKGVLYRSQAASEQLDYLTNPHNGYCPTPSTQRHARKPRNTGNTTHTTICDKPQTRLCPHQTLLQPKTSPKKGDRHTAWCSRALT